MQAEYSTVSNDSFLSFFSTGGIGGFFDSNIYSLQNNTGVELQHTRKILSTVSYKFGANIHNNILDAIFRRRKSALLAVHSSRFTFLLLNSICCSITECDLFRFLDGIQVRKRDILVI